MNKIILHKEATKLTEAQAFGKQWLCIKTKASGGQQFG